MHLLTRTISLGFLLMVIACFNTIGRTAAEVTHEEIRGTIQSLIYSYNQLDNKLERHEHRTRALGELLKKAMQALQKGQKNLEPINGIFARLDERVSQIETMLITQEEKYNVQTEKLGEALTAIFKWMNSNDPTTSPSVSSAPQTAQPVVSNEFISQQEAINKQLLDQIQKLSANVELVLGNTKNMMEQTDLAAKNVPSTAEVLSKIGEKLKAQTAPKDNSEFQSTVLEKFNDIVENIASLRATTNKPSAEGLTVADRKFIEGLNNETLNALEIVKNGVQISSTSLDTNLNKLLGEIGTSGEVLQKFYDQMNSSYNKFNDGLEIFNKFKDMLMTNSEYVLEIQRKVEFGTLQTVQKIGELIDKQTTGFKERFDAFDSNFLGMQTTLVQNLSSVIETEISHVWHQIEIMSEEISDSKDLINLVQKRNEVYVNSSWALMDGLSTKVVETKGRMLDMDSNLNFLLGKLSVMSQEFKNIKVGLAESLDELRRTFQLTSAALHQGPGPHSIDKTEYETVNLNKRHTAPNEEKNDDETKN